MLGLCFNLKECYFHTACPHSAWAVEEQSFAFMKTRGKWNGDQYPKNTPETFYFIKHFPIRAVTPVL